MGKFQMVSLGVSWRQQSQRLGYHYDPLYLYLALMQQVQQALGPEVIWLKGGTLNVPFLG